MNRSYSRTAATAYKNLVSCFRDPERGDYWRLANAFDSMTDFLRWWGGKDTALPGIVYKRYNALISPNNTHRTDCWYDDYGWWGIASAKAYDPAYSFFFEGEFEEKFRNIAKDCWGTMNGGKPGASWSYQGAPNAWTNRDNGNPDHDYWNQKTNWSTPRFGNGVGSGLQGVWQYDIFHEHRKQNECSKLNPCDPNVRYLGPFQNTVVNALYFLLALRLYNVGKISTTRQPILDEYGFFKAWFSKTLGDDSLLLFFGDTSAPAALVRERVTSYAEIDGEYPPVQFWNKERNACWGADQGLMIAALVEVSQMLDDPTAADTAVSIFKGVVTQMSDQNGILQPFYGDMGDLAEYKCGAGVFARCLLQAYSQPNSPLKPVIDDNKDNIRSVLLASADDACHRVPQNLFDNLNALSILTTAKVLGVIQAEDVISLSEQ